MFKLPRLLLASLLALSLPAHASWHLDGESSRLSFVTSHDGAAAQVHRFLVLHGKVDRKGAAELRIEMDSVLSGVPLQDEHLRGRLFEVERFPDAKVQAQLDLQPIIGLANGAQVELRLPLKVLLHGQVHDYEASLLATRLDEHRFQVVTLQPLILRAEDFDLAPGLETLRKLAGLAFISPSVPVNAVLIFNAR